MLEDFEESISITLRTRSSKKSVKNRRKLETPMLQLCIARQPRTTSMERPVARLIISSLNLLVFWKPVNPQECVWKNLYRNIMKTILQEKETIHYSTIIWFISLFLCLKLWKFLQRKQRWTRNGKNWRNFRRGTWRKSEARKRWLMKQEKDEKYTSLHWCTSVIWRMPNWRQSTKNTKVELYSEETFAKDDSGSYAVLAEQGSSASQMTAAKVMDIIYRLPGCEGQAADAVSACNQVKWKMLKIIENS